MVQHVYSRICISIVGGRVEVSHKSGQSGTTSTVSGIFIKSVLPNSPAGHSNMMNMGDRVISVNDHDLREATHEEAVQVIKNAKNPVKFVVQSLHSFPSQSDDINEENDEEREECEKNLTNWQSEMDECDNSGSNTEAFNILDNSTKDNNAQMITDELSSYGGKMITIDETPRRTSVASKFESEGKNQFEFDNTSNVITKTSINMNEEKFEGMKSLEQNQTTMESGNMNDTTRRHGIDPDSAAALPKRANDPEEEDQFFYTKDKISRKYGNLLGDTILLKLDKLPRGGLGLSLASNHDHDHDRMNVLVVAVKSTCPLSVKIGDELLEVNGKVLIGLSHLDASSIMRECCEDGILELLVLRRFEALVTIIFLFLKNLKIFFNKKICCGIIVIK
ncbi:unnamed protein product [Brugia timori]|uniref:PDZ domain-containing protein n=1 Tax=Brugia timori TaxID=42155 RepID=A0A0R3R040_9BILA|nr:unnamed protein product [Brugia timori]